MNKARIVAHFGSGSGRSARVVCKPKPELYQIVLSIHGAETAPLHRRLEERTRRMGPILNVLNCTYGSLAV